LLLVEAGLLAVYLGLGTYWIDGAGLTRGSVPVAVLAACAAAAMGVQNVVVRDLVGSGVATTYITGMLTNLAEDVVRYARDRTDCDARRRALLHGGMWAAFLAGGVGGAAAAAAWDLWSLVLPIVVLLAVATAEASRFRARAAGPAA
jgi:uncharacterized membrane protein YoaK (UPF0700 family)